MLDYFSWEECPEEPLEKPNPFYAKENKVTRLPIIQPKEDAFITKEAVILFTIFAKLSKDFKEIIGEVYSKEVRSYILTKVIERLSEYFTNVPLVTLDDSDPTASVNIKLEGKYLYDWVKWKLSSGLYNYACIKLTTELDGNDGHA
jgi:hypothetical protein